MRIEILDEKTNQLTHRREARALVKDFKGTPAKAEVLKALAEKLNTSQNALVLESLRQEYGKREASCAVKIYENEKFKQKYEPKPKEKSKPAQAEKPAPAEKPAQPEKKPKEKPEQNPEEKKKESE